MAIRAILDSLDGVDPPVAALYSEQTINGKAQFVLDVEGVDLMPSVRGLKTAHEATRTKLTTAQTALAAAQARLDGLPDDFDADTFETLRIAAEKGTKLPDPAETERQLQARVARETAKEKKRADDAEARAVKLQQQRDATERNRVLSDELTKAGVTDPDFQAACRVMLAGKTKVTEDEAGNAIVFGIDAEYQTEVPVSQMVGDWAKSPAGKKFVAARGDAGGGAGGGNGGAGGVNLGGFSKENFNLTEFGKLVKANPAEARRIAMACGKPEYAPDL